MKIRPATLDDSAAIWSMLEPVFRAGDTYAIDPDISREEALAYWHGPSHRVFVAEDETTLGTYYLKPNQQGGGSHVCNAAFITAPVASGRGVARAMLDHALRTGAEAGFAAMQFNFVLDSNARAVDIWLRAGFEVVGRLPRAFRHPDGRISDALVMMKDL